MARLARVVIPGVPHHVTQRGNRRLGVFFEDSDYEAYLALLRAWCAKAGTEIWAYCLMPNHVHLILTPSNPDGLRAALGETHRRYTQRINKREDWRGYLWQGRFHSFPMDDRHLVACARYVAQNPVRAGLVERAEDWRWSSARAHLAERDDDAVRVAPLLERIPDWTAFLGANEADAMLETLRQHGRTGRPLGAAAWLETLEVTTGRRLRPALPGRPKKNAATARK